ANRRTRLLFLHSCANMPGLKCEHLIEARLDYSDVECVSRGCDCAESEDEIALTISLGYLEVDNNGVVSKVAPLSTKVSSLLSVDIIENSSFHHVLEEELGGDRQLLDVLLTEHGDSEIGKVPAEIRRSIVKKVLRGRLVELPIVGTELPGTVILYAAPLVIVILLYHLRLYVTAGSRIAPIYRHYFEMFPWSALVHKDQRVAILEVIFAVLVVPVAALVVPFIKFPLSESRIVNIGLPLMIVGFAAILSLSVVGGMWRILKSIKAGKMYGSGKYPG
ncbi:MAG: hypothetical protein OXQ31_13990, partial [Spirochaetaceae bacterium]|nr:hypothetical protein [Spirochaetaceae bacterium]